MAQQVQQGFTAIYPKKHFFFLVPCNEFWSLNLSQTHAHARAHMHYLASSLPGVNCFRRLPSQSPVCFLRQLISTSGFSSPHVEVVEKHCHKGQECLLQRRSLLSGQNFSLFCKHRMPKVCGKELNYGSISQTFCLRHTVETRSNLISGHTHTHVHTHTQHKFHKQSLFLLHAVYYDIFQFLHFILCEYFILKVFFYAPVKLIFTV